MGTDYYARIPGATGEDAYANLYFHPGQNKIVGTGSTADIGFKFTAPVEASYKIDLAGAVPTYVGDASSDGVILKVFDKDLTLITEISFTKETDSFTKVVELAKDENVYFFFNKNGTTYSDYLVMEKLDMILQAAALDQAEFPAPDLSNLQAEKGQKFDQFFNIADDATAVALWKPFYVGPTNNILPLEKHATDLRYVLPSAVATGDNAWATIWEGIGNIVMPTYDIMIGDYFVAPSKGTVKVVANLKYPTDYRATSNPIVDSADGINVTVYKNAISDENVLIEKTLVDYDNSGVNGKILSAENVSVEKGDVIIFVYDKNNTIWNDSTQVLEKYVEYTDVETTGGSTTTKPEKVPETSDNMFVYVALIVMTALSAVVILRKKATK